MHLLVVLLSRTEFLINFFLPQLTPLQLPLPTNFCKVFSFTKPGTISISFALFNLNGTLSGTKRRTVPNENVSSSKLELTQLYFSAVRDCIFKFNLISRRECRKWTSKMSEFLRDDRSFFSGLEGECIP